MTSRIITLCLCVLALACSPETSSENQSGSVETITPMRGRVVDQEIDQGERREVDMSPDSNRRDSMMIEITSAGEEMIMDQGVSGAQSGEEAGEQGGEDAGESAGESAGDLTPSREPSQRALTLVEDDIFESRLREPGCLAYDEQSNVCLIQRSETALESCMAYTETLNFSTPSGVIGDHTRCLTGTPDQADLESAQRYLNYLRSRSDIRPITVSTNDEAAECALVFSIAVIEGGWRDGVSCFEEIDKPLDAFSALSPLTMAWSVRESLALDLGLMSYSNVARRDLLLNPEASEVIVGLSHDTACVTTRDRTMTQATFMMYPGVGHVPLELVHPGNHHAFPVPWSITFRDDSIEIDDIRVHSIEDGRRQLEIEMLPPADGLSDPKHQAQWTFREPLAAGQIIRTKVEWRSQTGQGKLELYTALSDCGYVMPEQCDPSRRDECVAPEYQCNHNRLTRPESWSCLREGLLNEGEPCGDQYLSCRDGMICAQREGPSSADVCIPLCFPDPSSERSCDLCPESYVTGPVASVEVGVCMP